MTEVVYPFFGEIPLAFWISGIQKHMDVRVVRFVMERPVPTHSSERNMMFLGDTSYISSNHTLPAACGIIPEPLSVLPFYGYDKRVYVAVVLLQLSYLFVKIEVNAA